MAAFTAWLDAAPAREPQLHREAFDRAQQVWLQADGLRTLLETNDRLRPRRRPQNARNLGWAMAAAAACAALVLGVRLSTPRRPPALPRSTTYATAAGERRAVSLPDGSQVELDGATTLVAEAVTPAGRSVTLVRGEASFDIVHEPSRPFTVDLGAARVRVLGTAFDIVRDPAFTQISVARGVVALDTAQRSVRIRAGRSAALTDGELVGRDVAPSDVATWRVGRRIYWDASLATVVADLDRSYALPVRLADARASRLRFTGVLAAGTRSQTVRRLTALLPIEATTQPDGEIVLRSATR